MKTQKKKPSSPGTLMVWPSGVVLMFTQQPNTKPALKCGDSERGRKQSLCCEAFHSARACLLSVFLIILIISGCCSPPLGICCTSLPGSRQHCSPPQLQAWPVMCALKLVVALWSRRVRAPCVLVAFLVAMTEYLSKASYRRNGCFWLTV